MRGIQVFFAHARRYNFLKTVFDKVLIDVPEKNLLQKSEFALSSFRGDVARQ